MDFIIIIISGLLALVLGISVHEFSHALSADLLGDPTARYQGRLTLNPMAHFDPIGGLMILISSLTGFGFGWGKPVPVNPANLRFGPRIGMAITAGAGPFSNIVLATLFAAPLRLINTMPYAAFQVIYTVVSVNVALAVFNMLPLYPLDGFSVLRGVLATVRARWAYDLSAWLDSVASWGPMLFIALLALGQVIGRSIIWTVLGPVYKLLMRLILG